MRGSKAEGETAIMIIRRGGVDMKLLLVDIFATMPEHGVVVATQYGARSWAHRSPTNILQHGVRIQDIS